MTTAIDTGAYIYTRLGWVDSWRLQKLTYYAQAWSLAWTGRALFETSIEAWDDGPVSRELYKVNKYDTGPMSTELPGADLARLSEEQKAMIDSVVDFYRHLSRQELIEQTHVERPWADARKTERRNPEITRPSMLSYYSKVAAQGLPRPTRPVLAERPVDLASFRRSATLQTSRWHEALARLAQ